MVEANVFTGIFFTVFLVILSLAGLRLVRRKIPSEYLATHHDVTDPLLQVVGMMFAVLLGFMVGDAMQRFQTARSTVQQEAASVGDVFRLTEGLPKENRDEIRARCVRYVDVVVGDEWPKLQQKKTSNAAWKAYDDLWSACLKLQPKNQAESNIQQSILPCMVSVGDNRRMRVEALHNGLPLVLWAVLGIGGIATIIFTFFFGSSNMRLQSIMTSLIALTIGLNIFLLACYDDPFSGDVMVRSDAFTVDKRIFNTVLDPSDPYEMNNAVQH
ncbi:MAG TPA: bestrophin family ion channel [Planktothrix sp.]